MDTMTQTVQNSAAMMTPRLTIDDAVAAYWFAQVNLRLRREVCWCWHQRMQQPGAEGVLPPLVEAAVENLDMIRYSSQKQQFFLEDPSASFLSEQIDELTVSGKIRSRWLWVVDQLGLNAAEQFVLGLGFASQLDAGLAPVFSTCLNDYSRPFPTLALAQRLWDDPIDVLSCANPNHVMFRYGLLRNSLESGEGQVWQRPIEMPSMVAQQLVDPQAELPRGIDLLTPESERELDGEAKLLVARLRAERKKMQIVPLVGPKEVAFSDWAACLGEQSEHSVADVPGYLLQDRHQMLALASVCWIRNLDIVLPDQWTQADQCKDRNELLNSVRELPLCWYLPLADAVLQHHFSSDLLTPQLLIKGLDFDQRVDALNHYLGLPAQSIPIVIEECARRFRFQEAMIARMASSFIDERTDLTRDNLMLACANEAIIEMGNLAQQVEPRFEIADLILPKKQSEQFGDILHAMRALTVVHYHWGTARVWNESGLSVLFCGTPGTGKTMSAEVLANELNLPMFRIDLSQVVNKYIGETEKNLKRIFDAAELSDCILFFDEADALFGKRTDVKDAHDRFANIEISYLLERMERFKGLAILATNRRKDLDEAFMRRLRYLIEFPVPDFEERMRLWEKVFPVNIDTSELDMRFLAKQFQLSGGHIRSIAFNACLRAADPGDPHAEEKIGMRDVLMTVRRELEKLNRLASDELFGNYSHLLTESVTK
jgi:vesicle-fusing ATPase